MKKTSALITVVVTLLCICGIAAVFTATLTYNHNLITNQLTAYIAGFMIYLCLLQISPHTVRKGAIYSFITCLILLIAVLIFGTGYEETGSKSWIGIGGFSFQPSEFVKIGFIISFASHIAHRENKINNPRTVAELLLHSGIIITLLCLQPDFGTAFVFFFITVVMMFAAGIKARYFIGGAVFILAAAPLLWFNLKEYQKNRILVFLNPELDPTGAGYNVIQAKTALGSGGMSGQGYTNGLITQSDMLPSKHTDFIFSVIGEETGFIGCSIILILLFTLIIICFITAMKSDNFFDKLVLSGSGAFILCHTVINTGMCVGILPVTGIPLPFISYGGTSVISNLISAGIVSSICLRLPKHCCNNNRKKRNYPHTNR